MWNKLSKRWGFISSGSVEMADAAAAAAKRKKIIEDAKQRAKTMRRNTIFNFGLPSTKSNGPLPQFSLKKTNIAAPAPKQSKIVGRGSRKAAAPVAAPAAAAVPAAIQKNNRSMTQRLRNSLFGRSAAPAPVASAPAPLAAPVAAPADNAPVAPPLLNVKTRRKARSQIPNVNAARKFIKEYNNIPNEQKKDLDAIKHAKYLISKEMVYRDDIPYIIRRKLNDDDPNKNKEGIKIFTDFIEEYQEISLFKGPNDKIQGLYTDLNKKILEIIPERKKLDQLKKDRKISIDSTTQTNSEKAETIRKYNELRNSLFNKHRNIMTLINGIDLHIKTCEVKKRLINQYQELDFLIDYNVFTVREPIFLKNIREYIEYLEKAIEDLGMNTRSTLLYRMIDDVGEEKSTIILNKIAIKSTNNDFYDDSDSIRQEMNEAIALFTDKFPFVKELKKIRDTRNKIYDMNESLELKGLYYSYRKSRNRGPETTVEDHKNKITEVLRSKIEKNKNDIDKRKYTDEDIQFFLERRGQYNDTEEMAYIENILLITSNFRDLLKMANYINKNQISMYINDIDYVKLSTDDSYYSKKSNEAFDTVIKMYYQEKNKSLDDKMFIRRSFIDKRRELLNQKKNSNNIRNEDYKEVIKSIIKDNKFTTPYRLTKFLLAIPQIQKEGIQKNFIQRIYNSIEQEDMDKVIKEKKIKNEIDTNEKAMAFAKEYLSKTDEPTEDDRYRFDKSFELLRKDKLWPIYIEEAKTFIEKYKGINETDPKYFILKKAEGIIQKGKETAAKEKEAADAKAEAEAAAKAASEAAALAEAARQAKPAADTERCMHALPSTDTSGGLRHESHLEAYNRNLIFMYYTWKKLPIPDKKYNLTDTERTEFFDEYKKVINKNQEEIINTLFNTSLDDFNIKLQNFEKNYGNRILDENTDKERCVSSMASFFGRLHSIVTKEILNKRQYQYWIDSEKFICSSHIFNKNSKEWQINRNCITITNSIIDDYLEAKDVHSSNYILVDSKYIPLNTDSQKKTISVDIIYDRMFDVSFVVDAFNNNGVLEIEPELEERIRTDFPEVLNKLYTNDVEKIRKNITRLIANLKPFRFNNMTRKRRQKALNNAKAKLGQAMEKVAIEESIKENKKKIAAATRRADIPRPKGPRPATASTPGLLGGPAVPPVVAPVAAALSQVNILLQKPRGPKGRRIPVVSPEAPGAAVAPGAAIAPGPEAPVLAPAVGPILSRGVASVSGAPHAPRRPNGPNPRRLVPAPQSGPPAPQPGPPAPQPGPPALQPGPPAPQPGPPAPQPEPPAPQPEPPAPQPEPPAPQPGPPAPSPRQPTAASTNNSPKNIKTRIGTIRQKLNQAKAKINAFKARPKTKAKGGSRTRKLKSRR